MTEKEEHEERFHFREAGKKKPCFFGISFQNVGGWGG